MWAATVSGTTTSEVKAAEQELCSLCGHSRSQQAPKASTADLQRQVLCLRKFSALQHVSEDPRGSQAAHAFKANLLYPLASFRATTATPASIRHQVAPRDLPINQLKSNSELSVPLGYSMFFVQKYGHLI